MRISSSGYLLTAALIVLFTTILPLPSQRPTPHSHIWASVQQYLQVKVDPSHITFYFYNHDNKVKPIGLNLHNYNGTIPTLLNTSNLNYFISHGSGDSYRSMISIKDLILDQQDANIFLIDWSHHAAMFYTVVVTVIPKLASIMGQSIDKYLSTYDITPANINLVGHSLGAHVSGGIGAHLQGKANYILATDPAGPLFQNEKATKRLDSTDAQFVQVLHTNGGFQGMMKAIGHADFYPNGGGMNQPGCGPDLFGTCAHARARTIYKESLVTGGFVGRKCPNYKEFKSGKCDNNEGAEFGGLNLNKTVRGLFYFDTNNKSPFAMGG